MTNTEYKVLQSEINHTKDDIKELKLETKEIKEDIKQLNHEIRDNNSSLREAIDILKDNLVMQTQMLDATRQNNEYEFKDIKKDVVSVKEDMIELKDSVNQKINVDAAWYRDYLTTNTKIVLKIIFFVIMILSGLKLANIDVIKLITSL